MALLTVDAAAGEAIAFACRRRGVTVQVVDADVLAATTEVTVADVLLVDLRSEGVAGFGEAATWRGAGVQRVVALGDYADVRSDVRPDAWVGHDAGVADLLVAIAGGDRSRRPNAGPSPDDAELLTPREREIMRLLLAGVSAEDTATHLGIARNTIRTHLQNVISKLGVGSRAEAAAWALRAGLQPADVGREPGA